MSNKALPPSRKLRKRGEPVLARRNIDVAERADSAFAFTVVMLFSTNAAAFTLIRTDRFLAIPGL